MGAAAGAIAQGVTGIVGFREGIKASDAQAQELLIEARLKDLQADQQIRTAEREERLLRLRGEQAKGRVKSAAARGGVTLEGSPLQQLEEIAADVEDEAFALQERTDFNNFLIRQEGDSRRRAARQLQTASRTFGVGTFLGSGGAQAISLINTNNSTGIQKPQLNTGRGTGIAAGGGSGGIKPGQAQGV